MFLKKKSKRQTTKHRVKVEKKVREHKRKLRKEAKKNPKKAKKKDPGIPNILPFKEEIIKEVEAFKEKKEQEREKKKAARQRARDKLKNQNRNLAGIVKDAEKRQAAYDKQHQTGVLGKSTPQSQGVSNVQENSRKAYYKEVSKVIDAADIILEVLDARDPMGSRCKEMEDLVKSSPGNKRLVLVLNKIDLVPKENVEAWLKHLRLELPAVAFKASTQSQRDHLTQSKVNYFVANEDQVKSSHCLGADVLMKLLRNYCRGTEMSVNVGVVGFPNTGKSSIINSLKRSKACDVGAVPGVTKAMQTVQLDKHIKLLDSPGVVLTNSTSDVAAVLRNVVKLETLEDPVPCVQAILSRCQKTQMMLHYNIATYSDTTEFLSLLAIRLGKLKKGGIPDVNRAARTLLQDWNSGKITYYTAPPEKPKDSSVHLGATIVSGWGKEFNLDDIQVDERNMMATLPDESAGHMLVSPLEPLSGKVTADGDDEEAKEMSDEEEDEDDDVEEMEEDEEPEELKGVSVVAKAHKKKGAQPKVVQVAHDFRHRVAQHKAKKVGGLMTKKANKLMEKKMKKKKKKAEALSGKLSNALENAFSSL